MRKFNLFTLLLFVLFISCTNSVSDKLSDAEKLSLIKKDPIYEVIIAEISLIRDSIIMNNDTLNNKFRKITYRQCLKYEKKLSKELDVFIESHKNDIDRSINDMFIDYFIKLDTIKLYYESDSYRALFFKKHGNSTSSYEYNYMPIEILYSMVIREKYQKEWELIRKKIDSDVFEYFNLLYRE